MWNIDIETKIVEHGRRGERAELNKLRDILLVRHKEANYMLSRFLNEYGDRIDTDEKCTLIFKSFSDEYSSVNRLLAILNAYDK